MNIFGEGFEPFVDTQIKVRQEKYAAGLNSLRTNEDVLFLNSKTSFVRLMSSVEVKSDSNYKYINSLGLNNLELAKQYILFAGTTNINSSFQRSGLGSDGAYGTGGNELGYRPMPGVTSAEIKTDGNGFTNSATVKIKVWNRQQLEIIDALYLRLGYYMLLEWGHVVYWDNNKNLINDPNQNSLKNYFFDPSNKNINDVLKKIQEKRISSNGNYDALFGKVINFSWAYGSDNSFDVTINLRSIGDIIEALKINSLKSIPAEISSEAPSDKTIEPSEYYKDKNAIGKLYYIVKNKILNNAGYFIEPNSIKSSFNPGEKTFCKIPFVGANTEWKYYVKFSRFLAEIQNSYVYLFNGEHKGLNIDFNIDTNLIPINELTISVDPRICIVSRTDTVNPKSIFPTINSESFTWDFYNYLDSFIYELENKALYGKIMNIYLNFDFLLQKLDELTDPKTNKASLKEYLNSILIEVSRSLGSSNNLEVTIDETTNTLYIIDKNPYPFKDDLLKEMGKYKSITKFNVTGYYNSNVPETSFVKNLNIQTEIPPDFANIISIGAAADKKIIGEDSTAFSKLNEGLYTRFAETVTDGKETIQQTSSEETPSALIPSSKTYFEYVIKGSNSKGLNLQWNDNTFESNKSILSDLIIQANKLKSKESQDSSTVSPTSGFIPVNISLTMDGLSGMKIFQQFDLDTSYLPSNYPNAVEILIKGISHTIQNNVWDTTIESVIVGKSSMSTISFPSYPSKENPNKDTKAKNRGYTLSSDRNKCSIKTIPKERKIISQSTINNFFKNKGYSKASIAGIISNLKKESSLNLNAFNPSGGGCGAYGLAQWRGVRQTNLYKYSQSIGKSIDSPETQLGFLYVEIEASSVKRIKTNSDPSNTSYIFASEFEIFTGSNNQNNPEVIARKKLANQIFNQLT